MRILLLFFSLSLSTILQAQWEWVMPKPQGYTLYDLDFFSSAEGIAVGERGAIIRTYDGGETWYNQPGFTNATIYNVQILDETVIYAACGTTLFKSSDRGFTWSPISVLSTFIFRQVFFLNELVGFAASGDLFAKTHNGGKTWSVVDQSWFYQVTSLHFSDSLHGFTLNNNSLYRTTDGGVSFELFKPYSSPYQPVSLQYMGHGHWICGLIKEHGSYPIGGQIIESFDNGENWSVKVVESGMLGRIFYNSYEQIFSSYSGEYWDYIGGSTDNGLTFTYSDILENLLGASLSPIVAVGRDTAFATHRSKVLRTCDGGQTWHSTIDVREYLLQDIAPVKGDHAWAATDRGFLSTHDRGASWQMMPHPSANINQISFYDENYGMTVCKNNKEVWTTENGGTSWTMQGSLISGIESVKELCYVSTNTAYIMSDTGTSKLFKTTNNGSNWEEVVLPAGIYSNIQFLNASIGYLSGWVDIGPGGTRATLYRTTDGGASWNILTIPNYIGFADAGKMQFAADGSGFIDLLGHYQSIVTHNLFYRTASGEWQSVFVESTEDSDFSYFFLTPDSGYTIINNFLFSTTNRGVTWNILGEFPAFNAGVFFSFDKGYLLGDYGDLIRISPDASPLWVEEFPVTNALINLQVYPNPASFTFSVQLQTKSNLPSLLEIMSIDGKLLRREMISGTDKCQSLTINAETWPSGLYVYRLMNGKEVKAGKIVIKK